MSAMLRLTRTSRFPLPGTLRVHARAYRAPPPRYDTKHEQPRSSTSRTLGYIGLGGVAAGSVVLIGAYYFYHTSGIKKVVDTVRPALTALKTSRLELNDSHPVAAMKFLRQAVKAYVSYYPGAGFIVDRAFDGLDGIVEAHSEDINDIIMRGHNSIREIIERDGNDHKPSSVVDILAVLRQMLVEIKDLSLKAGAPIAERLELEKRLNELGGNTTALFAGIASKAPEVTAKLGEFGEYVKVKSPEIAAKIGEHAQSAKDYAVPKASSLLETVKAQAPGIRESVSTATEKAKNAVFPPKDS